MSQYHQLVPRPETPQIQGEAIEKFIEEGDFETTRITIEYILIAFQEKDKQLLEECVTAVKAQTVTPTLITIVIDPLTPIWEEEYLHEQFPNARFIESPKNISREMARRHYWAYEHRSPDSEYVAFQQLDDVPFISRLGSQLRELLSHPECGICLGGCYVITNKKIFETIFRWFQPWETLFTIGYPSFWMLNTHLITHLTDLRGYGHPDEWDWDMILLTDICCQTSALLLKYPVGYYNKHEANASANINEEKRQIGYAKAKDYFTAHKEQVKPFVEVERNAAQ